jgi:hypothetical protein
MHATRAALGALALAAAFGLGRLCGRGAGGEDPADVASFRRALEDEDQLTRTRRMSAFLEHLSPENLPAAQAALLERQVGVSAEEVRVFMLAWARFDAPGAFAWAQVQPAEWRPTLAKEAIYAWGFRDPQGALRALEAIDDAALQKRLRASLVSAWARSPNKAGAMAYLSELRPEEGRDRFLFWLAGETAKGGPEAVIRWTESIPDDAPNDLKRAVFPMAAGAVAHADAARAAEWYEAHRGDPYSAGSLEVIARRWVTYHDPPALFAWLESLGDLGERAAERGRAVALAFRLWLERDREAASAWLRSEAPRPALDPVVATFAREIAATDPTDAFAWSERIQDESLRHGARVAAARIWLRHDPAAARAWLETSDLTDELAQPARGGLHPP